MQIIFTTKNGSNTKIIDYCEKDSYTKNITTRLEKYITNKKEINDFATKYYALYSNKETTEEELEDGFGKLCFELGFKMDTGKAFIERYSLEAFEKSDELSKIIETVDDPYLLGNAIFSFWRKVTHWCCESLLEDKNRKWMMTAFARLKEITLE